MLEKSPISFSMKGYKSLNSSVVSFYYIPGNIRRFETILHWIDMWYKRISNSLCKFIQEKGKGTDISMKTLPKF